MDKTYPIQQPMQDKLTEKNAEVLQAQASLGEMIELARALAGAPKEAMIGDISVGFVMPATNGSGPDIDGDGRGDA